MVFKKGHKTWNKGVPMDEERKELQRKLITGKKPNLDTRKKMSLKHKGHKNYNIELKGCFKKGHEVLPEWKNRAREYRKNQIIPTRNTSIELKIQDYLKELKIEFFTHVHMKEIEHPYHCDIFIPVQKSNTFFIIEPIIIECDGDYFHKYPTGRIIDHIQKKELESKGFKVIRLWERDISKMELKELENKLRAYMLGVLNNR